MSTRRRFGALIAHDSVCVVEYATERSGLRLVQQWTDNGRSDTIADALAKVGGLLSSNDVRNASLALAVEQFGFFHHVMTVPSAADDVLRPVVRREVQRVFGVADAAIAFTRGATNERRSAGRADAHTVPRQLYVAAALRESVDALGRAFEGENVQLDIATVVPKAIHSLYAATGAGQEPTAVLVCLRGGPHLLFFLDGRLELAIDPPIALEGDRGSVAMTLDQVERGALYFRQQFRGASATRLLLAAPSNEYEALAAAIHQRFDIPVGPLFTGAPSPEAVIAMGAALEARELAPLDLFPHAPTVAQRAAVLTRGPNLLVTGAVAAAILACVWSLSQFAALNTARRETDALHSSIQRDLPVIAPMRDVAEHRADLIRQVAFVEQSNDARVALTGSLAAIAQAAPAGVQFDSLRVTRSAAGWSAMIGGETIGATTGESVRNLDAFFNAIRNQPGVSAPNLDQFQYPSAPRDSTHTGPRGVEITFRMSFQLARDGAVGAVGAAGGTGAK